MKTFLTWPVLALFLTFGLVVGCDWKPETVPENPFVNVQPNEIETLTGKLFPFSASIATSATHRMEKNGRLVGYIASPVVDLRVFEGDEVEVEGIWRSEGRQEIFWVESIILAETNLESVTSSAPVRFLGDNFTFTYPYNWEVNQDINGRVNVYKMDGAVRELMMTITPSDFSTEAERLEANMDLNGLAAHREISVDERGRDLETMTVYSFDGLKQYVFESSYAFDDNEKRQEIAGVLNTFVEGRENVQAVIEKDRLEAAQKMAERAAERKAETEKRLRAKAEELKVEDKSFLEGLFDKEDSDPTLVTESVEESDLTSPVVAEDLTFNALDSFTNTIDDRGHIYNNPIYGAKIFVPYTFWYRSFGPGEDSILEFGTGRSEITSQSDSEILLSIKSNDIDQGKDSEVQVGDMLTVTHVDGDRLYIATGPISMRDDLWSIVTGIERP